MKVEDIVKEVLVRLGDYDKFNPDNLPENDVQICLIVKCINMIQSEIATDYLHIETKESVLLTNGSIGYDKLKKRLINLKKVSQNGRKIKARIFPNEIVCEADGIVDLYYYYLPDDVKIGQVLELSPQVTLNLITNGVLGEYCLLQGRYEDSVFYDKKYREMLKIATKCTKSIVLRRGWW